MFNALSWRLRRNLPVLRNDGLSYCVVRVRLKDGRVYRNVVINEKFRLDDPASAPFHVRDIADLWWDGYRGSERSMTPVPVPLGEAG